MVDRAGAGDAVGYYTDRTDHILDKYGPGPIVHFHTGLVDPADRGLPPEDDPAALKAAMASAQCALVADSAQAWDGARWLSGEVLDVGCGLGGTAIQWALEHGTRVHALTNVSAHADLVSRFAREAGVAQRVEASVGDAAAVPGRRRFDAAVAIESSCYLDRAAWFRCLSRILRPGAGVYVVDCFTDRTDVAAAFDRYWRTRIGGLAEYEAAASAVGFRLVECEVLNSQVLDFWTLSLRRSLAHLRSTGSPRERRRLRSSLAAHGALRAHLARGRIQYARLAFAGPSPGCRRS